MDSLSQFVLGATVSTAVLGPRIGAGKAVLIGGALGTLPDLDVLWPFDDPIDAFVWHRSVTHSLLVHAVAAPVFGEGLARLFKGLRGARIVAAATVFLIFATHALLDATTIYGTRLFWPIWPEPLGVGSMFIIDPLYTLPLLVATVWVLCLRSWTVWAARVTAAALALSTGYLGWSLVGQQIVLAKAAERFAAAGIVPDRTLALAAPLTTWLWRVVAIDDDRYHQIYLRPVDTAQTLPLYSYPRALDTVPCNGSVRLLDHFTDGFWAAAQEADAVVIEDLRMGLPPNYAFRFAVADHSGATRAPERRKIGRGAEGDVDWLLASLAGPAPIRPAEAAAVSPTIAVEANTEAAAAPTRMDKFCRSDPSRRVPGSNR